MISGFLSEIDVLLFLGTGVLVVGLIGLVYLFFTARPKKLNSPADISVKEIINSEWTDISTSGHGPGIDIGKANGFKLSRFTHNREDKDDVQDR